ncbi:beta-ketoacyl synthase N-terminal-like domain-containing protein [Brevibacillus sp. DP1.3A]|uniref:beta-ketoacyl synthase N-terminal-like domain-containing protein n=1 Tax=Brevibacillus sp. DP1.3A TaxID=2738867 RepID=UPI00156BBBF8|nr:beta-ketoacyl synthase N-terminal-like domain-containing protein [Brevibacillus sp. DP1.3A]UED75682.1 polyketide beta-ketoacyl:ACP synthase [Brevibacillus sp. DP1.3A]
MGSWVSCRPDDIVISGIGITSAIGQGQAAFAAALLDGRHAFSVLNRPGRQKGSSAFLGAEIESLVMPERLSKRLLRTASFSGQAAMATMHEAWEDAVLDQVEPERIGLIIGGSNLQQREALQAYTSYSERPSFLRPTYAMTYMDSDLCGLCTEQFGIRGFAFTLGGASASGQAVIAQAVQAVSSGEVDACIAVGALADLSYMELAAFRNLGAMGSDQYADRPDLACRPFDRGRDGFIYGENCAAVVIERASCAGKRGVLPYAAITATAIAMDGNRNPNPSYEGEMRVIREALLRAGIAAADIDYVNPHGTGSPVGDETELRALKDSGLSHAYINATKSITGHGLSAAGAVEIIAVLLQMRNSRLHPTRNLELPVDESFNWVKEQFVPYSISRALCLSMGFGGMNTAVILQKI